MRVLKWEIRIMHGYVRHVTGYDELSAMGVDNIFSHLVNDLL